MFPASPAYQALFIVCQFGVILGGLSRTAVYKPAFYGFVLAVLVPLIARVAIEGDQVHLFTAGVLGVVLVFVLAFGRQVNDVLTQSLTMRYENVDLIRELKAQTEAALAARAAAETASLAKSQFLAAASHDLRQPLHAMGLFAAALAARVRDPGVTPLVASIRASVEALEHLFARAARSVATRRRRAAARAGGRRAATALHAPRCRLRAAGAGGGTRRFASCRRAWRSRPTRCCSSACSAISSPMPCATRRPAASSLGARRRGRRVRIDVIDSGVGIADGDATRVFDEFVQLAGGAAKSRRRTRHGARPRDRAPARGALRPLGRARLDAGPGIALLDHRAAREPRSSASGRSPRARIASPTLRPRARSPDGASSSSTTIRRSSRRCRRCSRRGTRSPPAAPTPATAIATLARRRRSSMPAVDLIVADLRLADGNSGIDAIARLRARLGADTPAIVVSGDTSAAAQAEVRAAGVKLLVKPVVAAALKEAAERAIMSRSDATARSPADAQRARDRASTRHKEEPGARPGSRRTTTVEACDGESRQLDLGAEPSRACARASSRGTIPCAPSASAGCRCTTAFCSGVNVA